MTSAISSVEWYLLPPIERYPGTILQRRFRPASKWYQSYKDPDYFVFFSSVTMPPRRQRNVKDATLHDQMAELYQSNQTLQQMMTKFFTGFQLSPREVEEFTPKAQEVRVLWRRDLILRLQ